MTGAGMIGAAVLAGAMVGQLPPMPAKTVPQVQASPQFAAPQAQVQSQAYGFELPITVRLGVRVIPEVETVVPAPQPQVYVPRQVQEYAGGCYGGVYQAPAVYAAPGPAYELPATYAAQAPACAQGVCRQATAGHVYGYGYSRGGAPLDRAQSAARNYGSGLTTHGPRSKNKVKVNVYGGLFNRIQ